MSERRHADDGVDEEEEEEEQTHMKHRGGRVDENVKKPPNSLGSVEEAKQPTDPKYSCHSENV